ncbi:MAG: hemolysin III family protein [Pseudomonadota bacterium]
MTTATAAHPPRHYPTKSAKCADLTVHLSGIVLAIVGAFFLVILSLIYGDAGRVAAVSVYSAGIIAMLSFSAIYNFAPAPKRPGRRKLDYSGIFLMIAASYTPFTTQRLEGAWAIGMTLAVWALAGFGIFAKFFLPGLSKRFWVVFYIALGWLVVVALGPMLAAVHWVPLLLLLIGGVIYTFGVIFHMMPSLTYSHAIWHGHVVAAAGTHWAAVLIGVVLVPGQMPVS